MYTTAPISASLFVFITAYIGLFLCLLILNHIEHPLYMPTYIDTSVFIYILQYTEPTVSIPTYTVAYTDTSLWMHRNPEILYSLISKY